jgi:pseudouridine synthase
MTKIVLQKFLSGAGVASRRQVEALIKGGNVKINGVMAKLGDRADESDDVRVRGKKVSFTNNFIYIKLNKPVGYVSTNRSFKGEHNVLELVNVSTPLVIVGRLDKDSEGLLMLTNDGELANKLTHPKFGIEKVYIVTLGHDIGKDKKEEKNKIAEIVEKFKTGVDVGLGEGIVKAERVKHLRGRSFEVVLRQGKKRQIRRMFRRLGFHVIRLVRVRIGNVTIGRLRKGQWEHINKTEIEKLKSLTVIPASVSFPRRRESR